jgi:hypothetical protein
MVEMDEPIIGMNTGFQSAFLAGELVVEVERAEEQ